MTNSIQPVRGMNDVLPAEIGQEFPYQRRNILLALPERSRCDRSEVRCASRKQIGEGGAKSAQTGRSFAVDRCRALATRRLTRHISEFRAAEARWREPRRRPAHARSGVAPDWAAGTASPERFRAAR